MEFQLDQKHEMARDLFRDFAEKEVKPRAIEVDETEVFPRDTVEKMQKYGFMQKLIKIDTDKEDATAVAEKAMYENGRKTYTYSFEIIEQYNSYTRASNCPLRRRWPLISKL